MSFLFLFGLLFHYHHKGMQCNGMHECVYGLIGIYGTEFMYCIRKFVCHLELIKRLSRQQQQFVKGVFSEG